jgi:hypothetical protein
VKRAYLAIWVVVLAAVGLAVAWTATREEDPAEGQTSPIASQPAPVPSSEPEPSPRPEPRAVFAGNGYELAQVRQGEEVQILDEPGGKVIKRIGDESELFGSPRVFSVVKPGPHWLGVTAAELGSGRIGWIRYDPERLLLGDTRISIRVDLSDRTLTLLRDDDVLREAVVTVGRAGTETPPGRFAVTDTITENLNPVYGAGAVVTSARQASLAEGWSGGNMIAIHGWAGPVGEAASGGCLRASNGDVLALIRSVPLGAPVFISA